MRNILIVDDLPDARQILGLLAQEVFPDCLIFHAASVAEAAHYVASRSLQISLVDLSLGDGSGIEVLQMLKARQPQCLAVVASIHDGDAQLFKALQAGADGYLLKDQAPELLRRQLQRITEGEPPLSPAVARRLVQHFQTPDAGMPEPSLTPREREILGFLARGLTSPEIARALQLSRHTVGDHIKNLYRKLNVSSRAEAALRARAIGLT